MFDKGRRTFFFVVSGVHCHQGAEKIFPGLKSRDFAKAKPYFFSGFWVHRSIGYGVLKFTEWVEKPLFGISESRKGGFHLENRLRCSRSLFQEERRSLSFISQNRAFSAAFGNNGREKNVRQRTPNILFRSLWGTLPSRGGKNISRFAEP
ncbi:hypothetical protein [uncultured Neglectibacter sp.]|uniref:hypothetical protein n=1 Tax=uncultured Neglectibacter sp. TaxID=1924108 RepID=UPI0034DF9F6C